MIYIVRISWTRVEEVVKLKVDFIPLKIFIKKVKLKE